MSDRARREPVRISLEEAKKRFDRGDVTILDVVDTPNYDEFDYQIKGAVRIRPEDIADQYERLPTDKAVLAY